MADSPERRLSTGGLPPVKIRQNCVVEEVPSHDTTPCFTAWTRTEILKIPQGWSASDFGVDDKRPQRSIQVYDTTPGADNPDRLKSLVETLHSETNEERQIPDRYRPNRIDLWGMPLTSDLSEKEKIEKCKAHILAEMAFRDSTNSSDFKISRVRTHDIWEHALLVIDRPRALWNEDGGGFLAVHWDVNPTWMEEHAEELDELNVTRYTRDELGGILLDFWLGMS